MPITKKEKLLVETFCDLCGKSQGTSLIDPGEYGDWLKHNTDLLTFEIEGKHQLLCWECIKDHGLAKAFNHRIDELTYGRRAGA